MASRVKVIRKAPLHFGPGPSEPSLVESCADRFDMSIKADASDDQLGRLEFSWRSPSSNLLMNPRVYLEFDLLVRSCRNIDQLGQACGNLGMDFNAAAAGPQLLAAATRAIRPVGLLGFGEGDPLLAAAENIYPFPGRLQASRKAPETFPTVREGCTLYYLCTGCSPNSK